MTAVPSAGRDVTRRWRKAVAVVNNIHLVSGDRVRSPVSCNRLLVAFQRGRHPRISPGTAWRVVVLLTVCTATTECVVSESRLVFSLLVAVSLLEDRYELVVPFLALLILLPACSEPFMTRLRFFIVIEEIGVGQMPAHWLFRVGRCLRTLVSAYRSLFVMLFGE